MSTTVDAAETERFNQLSDTWWNRAGPMRPLHVINDLRVGYVLDRIVAHFKGVIATDLQGLRILDLGCG